MAFAIPEGGHSLNQNSTLSMKLESIYKISGDEFKVIKTSGRDRKNREVTQRETSIADKNSNNPITSRNAIRLPSNFIQDEKNNKSSSGTNVAKLVAHYNKNANQTNSKFSERNILLSSNIPVSNSKSIPIKETIKLRTDFSGSIIQDEISPPLTQRDLNYASDKRLVPMVLAQGLTDEEAYELNVAQRNRFLAENAEALYPGLPTKADETNVADSVTAEPLHQISGDDAFEDDAANENNVLTRTIEKSSLQKFSDAIAGFFQGVSKRIHSFIDRQWYGNIENNVPFGRIEIAKWTPGPVVNLNNYAGKSDEAKAEVTKALEALKARVVRDRETANRA